MAAIDDDVHRHIFGDCSAGPFITVSKARKAFLLLLRAIVA